MTTDDAYDHFHAELMLILDKFVPIEKITVKQRKHKHEPWYSKNIQKYRTKCRKLYKKSLEDPSKVAIYRQYRNSLNRLINAEKKNYYSEKFKSINNDIAKTWNVINSIIRKSRDKGTIISSLRINNLLITNPVDISNEMNSHFVQAGERVSKGCVANNIDPTSYVSNANSSQMNFKHVSEHDIDCII